MKEAKVYQVKHPRYRYMSFFRRRGFATYRRYFTEKKDAKDDCEAFNKKLFTEGREGVHIGPREREQVMTALRILEGTGISIVEAAEAARKQQKEAGEGRELLPSVWDFLEAKERQGRSERTITNLKSRLMAFIEYSGAKTLQDFTSLNLEQFIYQGGSPGHQRNHFAALHNFANFAIRRGWIETNPLNRVEKPGQPPRDHIETFSADETKAFIRTLEAEHPAYVSFYAALLFAFLRPSEAEALRKEDFHKGRIRVTGGKMRGRKRRFVPIRKNLQSFLDAYGWEVPTTFWQRQCRALSPIPWKEDICRHTGISFRLAESRDERKTAQEAGNSAETIFAYYHEPKEAAEARRFWAIMAGS